MLAVVERGAHEQKHNRNADDCRLSSERARETTCNRQQTSAAEEGKTAMRIRRRARAGVLQLGLAAHQIHLFSLPLPRAGWRFLAVCMSARVVHADRHSSVRVGAPSTHAEIERERAFDYVTGATLVVCGLGGA